MAPADVAAVSRLYADGRTANQIAGRIGVSSDFARRLIRTAIAADPSVKARHDKAQEALQMPRRYRGARLVMTEEEKTVDTYAYPLAPMLDDGDGEDAEIPIDPETGETINPWEV